MTLTAEALEAAIGQMDADQLAHLGATFSERARQRRVLLTEDEARAVVASAPVSPAWERSQLGDVGRVRTATRLMIERGWHPEQIVSAMTAAAKQVIAHSDIASEAVAAGIADGMATREGTL
jgi:hypothetical protein